MGTKSRESIFGSPNRGAEIRLRSATDKLEAAQKETDHAATLEWSFRMQLYGGPSQPSPIAQAINGGHPG